ncbi:hypothetical protein [Streptomyces roseoverticillatus]|uniref:FXSXX-COOH protein n=1 Tax=Streptomyces roseoverticillatus TaxID=66429 RepID=A0ABV3IXC9_9ACTN
MTGAEDGAPGALTSTDAADVESVIVDISGLDLNGIAALPAPVRDAVLRRLHDSCADGDPFVTGHRESQ